MCGSVFRSPRGRGVGMSSWSLTATAEPELVGASDTPASLRNVTRIEDSHDCWRAETRGSTSDRSD